MSLGKRFREFRKEVKKTQQSVADLLGCTQSNINLYEKDEITPPVKSLQIIRQTFDVNLNWLLNGDGDMILKQNWQPNVDEMKKKVFKIFRNEFLLLENGDTQLNEECDNFWYLNIQGEIACGTPIPFQYEGGDQLIPVSKHILHNPEDVDILRVNGESMMPDIEHEDLVIIRKEHDWQACRNKIVAVRNDDGITLKKLVIDDKSKQALLIASNKNYDPIVVDQNSYLCGYLQLLVRYY
jgi:SOS-response transcriptional repressor LexA